MGHFTLVELLTFNLLDLKRETQFFFSFTSETFSLLQPEA